jgi:signal transduction histidine kinase
MISSPPVVPRWTRPVLAGAVVAELALTLVIDGRVSAAEHAPLAARLLVILVFGLAWSIELVWGRLPGPILVVLNTLPFAWLNVVREGTASTLFVVLAIGWASYTSTRRTSLVCLLVGLLGCLSYLVVVDPEGWLSTSVGLTITWFAVRSLLRQQVLLAEQERLLAELRQAQADLADRTRAAERRRIAAEIHDVAAHTLAVTMLHLTGVRLLLRRTGGDQRAIDALEQAERLGRQGLDDVRRTVGLLDDSGPSGSPPLPQGGDVVALVDQYRAAGLDVSLEMHGPADLIPPTGGVAVYRITQEALANVVKHTAQAPVRVRIDVGSRLCVWIHNEPSSHPVARSSAGSGFGLFSMRERVETLGGTFHAGPDAGGWTVACQLPLSAGHSSQLAPPTHDA